VNVQVELRFLKARVAALEALAARPRRKPAAPPPADDDMDERDGWWGAYLDAAMLYGGGRAPLKKGAFAIKHNIPVSEFYRVFSRKDRRGIPRGSGPYQRSRDELIEATAKLKTSHGTARASHNFAA
jgi:hypothetical protein